MSKCVSWVAMLNTFLTMICDQKSFKSITQDNPGHTWGPANNPELNYSVFETKGFIKK